MLRDLRDAFRLTDRAALGTGAGSGLGRAIAEGFAQFGGHVLCVDGGHTGR